MTIASQFADTANRFAAVAEQHRHDLAEAVLKLAEAQRYDSMRIVDAFIAEHADKPSSPAAITVCPRVCASFAITAGAELCLVDGLVFAGGTLGPIGVCLFLQSRYGIEFDDELEAGAAILNEARALAAVAADKALDAAVAALREQRDKAPAGGMIDRQRLFELRVRMLAEQHGRVPPRRTRPAA